MAETKFNVNGRDYDVPTDLTLGEMCDAERFFGVEFGNNETSGVRMAAALLWVAVSRVDKTVTVADIRALDPEVFTSLGGGDALPPASGAAESASPETSGDASSSAGDVPAETHGATGTPS